MARKLNSKSSVSRGTMPAARPNGWGAVKYGFQPQNSKGPQSTTKSGGGVGASLTATMRGTAPGKASKKTSSPVNGGMKKMPSVTPATKTNTKMKKRPVR